MHLRTRAGGRLPGHEAEAGDEGVVVALPRWKIVGSAVSSGLIPRRRPNESLLPFTLSVLK